MYRIAMRDGTQVDIIAEDYNNLMVEVVKRGITPKHISRIWTDVPIDAGLYNKVKKEIQREEG